MYNNLYLYNKKLQQHDRELLQEAEQQRMLAALPRPQSSLKKYITGRFAAFRVSLPSSTRQGKQGARTATGQLS
jgi:hypothetical protein